METLDPTGPRNEQGESPSTGGDSTTQRLREKERADHGRANRRRIEHQIEVNTEREAAVVRDPVCGKDVDAANPPGGKTDFRGTSYAFCSSACKATFDVRTATYGTSE